MISAPHLSVTLLSLTRGVRPMSCRVGERRGQLGSERGLGGGGLWGEKEMRLSGACMGHNSWGMEEARRLRNHLGNVLGDLGVLHVVRHHADPSHTPGTACEAQQATGEGFRQGREVYQSPHRIPPQMTIQACRSDPPGG